MVTSRADELVTAVAAGGAPVGVYGLRVNQLARAHQIAAQGFADSNSEITQGTLQLGIGSASTTITIDSTNNPLSGLAAAINNANAGVTATIVNDGRSHPYRLLLTSSKSGTANAITVVNNRGADRGSARKPEFSSTYVGAVVLSPGFTGTSTPTTKAGAGAYTGSTNNRYEVTVVNGGTVGTDNGIRLSFTDSTGANTGTITLNSGDAGVFKDLAQGVKVQFAAGTLIAGQKFTIDTFVPTVQAAADASVQLGSGSGAVVISSASNQLDGLVAGVTFTLQGANASKDVTVQVSADTAKASEAVAAFVDAYNEVIELINTRTRFDGKTGQAGLLLGHQSLSAFQEQVRGVLLGTVAGLNPLMNRLSALGITITDEGKLTVNHGRLGDALAGKLTGVTFEDVRRLFALSGQSSHPGIQFVTGGVRTQASTTPYGVDITQAACQASITATNALAASTVSHPCQRHRPGAIGFHRHRDRSRSGCGRQFGGEWRIRGRRGQRAIPGRQGRQLPHCRLAGACPVDDREPLANTWRPIDQPAGLHPGFAEPLTHRTRRPRNPYQTYRTPRNTNLPRVEILLRIDDGMIDLLTEALDLLRARDQGKARLRLARARAAVATLAGGIDPTTGELPRNFLRLYGFVVHCLGEGEMGKVVAARQVLCTLREGVLAIREEALERERRGAIPSLDRLVTVGDVVQLTGGTSSLREQIAALDLAEVVNPGGSMVISRAQIAYRVRLGGSTRSCFAWREPSTCACAAPRSLPRRMSWRPPGKRCSES